MAFLHRAGATSFSFLRVIQGTQQTLWSTAQWPRKKTRHTMSFTHTHIQRHAHYASPPLHSTCACTQKRKVHFHLMKVLLSIHFGIVFCLFNIIFQLTQGKAAFTLRCFHMSITDDGLTCYLRVMPYSRCERLTMCLLNGSHNEQEWKKQRSLCSMLRRSRYAARPIDPLFPLSSIRPLLTL